VLGAWCAPGNKKLKNDDVQGYLSVVSIIRGYHNSVFTTRGRLGDQIVAVVGH
jgi:hypothetical protein